MLNTSRFVHNRVRRVLGDLCVAHFVVGWVITGVLVLAGLGVIENAGKPPLPRGEGVLDRLGDMDDNPMNDPRFWD